MKDPEQIEQQVSKATNDYLKQLDSLAKSAYPPGYEIKVQATITDRKRSSAKDNPFPIYSFENSGN